MYQRRDYREDELVNMGFRARGRLAAAIHEAAERSGAESTSKWLETLARESAAATLGVDPESLVYEQPRPKRSGLAMPGLDKENAARLASYNALMLDAQEKLKQAAAVMAPVAVAPKARRR